MHGPPGPVAEPLADQAGDDQGDQQVHRDRPQSQPERPVFGHEGDEHVGDVDGGVAVEHGGDDMDGQRDTASRDVFLCRAETTKRGQPGRAKRTAWANPSTMVTVSKSRATSPKPRVMYHRALELVASVADNSMAVSYRRLTTPRRRPRGRGRRLGGLRGGGERRGGRAAVVSGGSGRRRGRRRRAYRVGAKGRSRVV